jgi:predicted Rossmann fold nucleotide-binding protein DprA/Smf involved in DNA uptake
MERKAMNAQIEAITRELAQVGIKPDCERLGSGHIRVMWSVAGKEFLATVAATASDHRAALNARAYARRSIRDYRPPVVVKNFGSVPESIAEIRVELAALKSEMSVLIDTVLDALLVVTAPGEFIPAPANNAGSAGQVQVLAALSFQQPKTPAEIAAEIGSTNVRVSATLNQLSKKGKVERIIGGWRKRSL